MSDWKTQTSPLAASLIGLLNFEMESGKDANDAMTLKNSSFSSDNVPKDPVIMIRSTWSEMHGPSSFTAWPTHFCQFNEGKIVFVADAWSKRLLL